MQELYQLIGLQPEVVKKLQAIGKELDLGEVDFYLEQMLEPETARAAYEKLDALLTEDEGHMRMLYCQLVCARRVFERYQRKGISQAVYVDTMKCFTRFLEECREKNGEMFFDRGWWTFRQISMRLFRIGALEYELYEQDGEKIVAIHIPSDADLSEASVDRSLAEADGFFAAFYPEHSYERYTCDSWLLSPVLRKLLPERSRIAAFQDRFKITEAVESGREYVEWLFQVPPETACEDLPERTSLQRKVKELMLAGGNIGSACGFLERKVEPQSGVGCVADAFMNAEG